MITAGRKGSKMEFDVKRNSIYLELTVKCDNVNASTGLLSEDEAINVAKELIFAAEQLLPASADKIQYQLASVTEGLERGQR